MGAINLYPGGVKAAEWNDATRTYTTWNAAGAQTSTRAYTAAENATANLGAAAQTTMTNREALAGKVQAALDANTTYLGLAAPTNAQVVAQVGRLTRETSALLRQVWSQLADISDT